MRSPPESSSNASNANGITEPKETEMERLLNGLRRRRTNQKGFTLIEMLVVISILGILAAVVTMSMAGVTALAHRRALEGERMELQGAMSAMIADQMVDPDQACSLYAGPSGGTRDMGEFPSGLPFTHSAGAGDTTDRRPVQLYPHYVRRQIVLQRYVCTGNGQVQPAG